MKIPLKNSMSSPANQTAQAAQFQERWKNQEDSSERDKLLAEFSDIYRSNQGSND
jgi:hypothetical protein